MEEKNMQFFNWGKIEWIYEADSIDSRNLMSIGIVTIDPGKRQNKHIHYGDEQLLYVISGKGRQQVDEEIDIIRAGSIHHIEAGSIHETMNMDKEPIVELIISIPVAFKENLPIYTFGEANRDSGKFTQEGYMYELIGDEIKGLYDLAMESLKLPIAIFDMNEKMLIEGEDYPELCKKACFVNKNNGDCPMYQIHDEYAPPIYNDSTAYVCPFGLTVFNVPIVANGTVIGWIKGGHIRTFRNEFSSVKRSASQSKHNKELFEDMSVLPKSRVSAILRIMKEMEQSFAKYTVLKKTETELSIKEERIKKIAESESILEESLKMVRDEMLDITINNHFLFNTLNAIASMAVQENSIKTYDAVIDLSKMFRYSLKNKSNKILLKDEIEYLRNYISLQKIRYGENLEVVFDVPEKLEKEWIPFNCLQPIVENCFKHAFKDSKGRIRIWIHAASYKNGICIRIEDDGRGMNSHELEKLIERILESKGRSSGLMMITSKLKSFYGDSFSFEIDSRLEGGTKVTLSLLKAVRCID